MYELTYIENVLVSYTNLTTKSLKNWIVCTKSGRVQLRALKRHYHLGPGKPWRRTMYWFSSVKYVCNFRKLRRTIEELTSKMDIYPSLAWCRSLWPSCHTLQPRTKARRKAWEVTVNAHTQNFTWEVSHLPLLVKGRKYWINSNKAKWLKE